VRDGGGLEGGKGDGGGQKMNTKKTRRLEDEKNKKHGSVARGSVW